MALVNDATHERINKGREDSHANTLSWTSFMIVSPHQNITPSVPQYKNVFYTSVVSKTFLYYATEGVYAKIVDVGQGRQRNDLCLFIFTQNLYCHRSFKMWCLLNIFSSQKLRTK